MQFQLDTTVPVHRLKTFIRQHLGGTCKILSQGSECVCPLCDLDRIYEALQASVATIALDEGKRERNDLG